MIEIRALQPGDVAPIAAAFAALGWNKPAALYERYLDEAGLGIRAILVAFMDGVFAGYVTILWRSSYAPFRARNVPEIQDFNVLPRFRRKKLGTALMDAAEARVAASTHAVGLGMALGGAAVRADDDLALFLVKPLKG